MKIVEELEESINSFKKENKTGFNGEGDVLEYDFEPEEYIFEEEMSPEFICGGIGLLSYSSHMDETDSFNESAKNILTSSKYFLNFLNELEDLIKDKFPNNEVKLKYLYEGNVK